MSLIIMLTGTGGAQGVPAFGCDCPACRWAQTQPRPAGIGTPSRSMVI